MKATQILHDTGQSLWLDNITRDLLRSGTLKRYIDELSVTGLTSNPTIFDHAIRNSSAYDDSICDELARGKAGEELFFDLALADLAEAADLFRPLHDRTQGVDGWVSLEVSPALAHETVNTVREAKDLSARAARPKLFIKIPGTKEGVPAIEEAIFAGVPVNVTLLFAEHTSIGPPLPTDGGDSEQVLAEFAQAGVDINALATQLQEEGASSFVKSWNDLIDVIKSKCAALKKPSLKAGG